MTCACAPGLAALSDAILSLNEKGWVFLSCYCWISPGIGMADGADEEKRGKE
jgi:hypothetical protein